MQSLAVQLRTFDLRNVAGVEDLSRLDTLKNNMEKVPSTFSYSILSSLILPYLILSYLILSFCIFPLCHLSSLYHFCATTSLFFFFLSFLYSHLSPYYLLNIILFLFSFCISSFLLSLFLYFFISSLPSIFLSLYLLFISISTNLLFSSFGSNLTSIVSFYTCFTTQESAPGSGSLSCRQHIRLIAASFNIIILLSLLYTNPSHLLSLCLSLSLSLSLSLPLSLSLSSSHFFSHLLYISIYLYLSLSHRHTHTYSHTNSLSLCFSSSS